MLTPKEYRPLALRTARPLPFEQQIWHASCGMMTELGELLDQLKKHRIYGKPLDDVNVIEELGDYAWYLNLWLETVGNHPYAVSDFEIGALPAEFSTGPVDVQKDTHIKGLVAIVGSLFYHQTDMDSLHDNWQVEPDKLAAIVAEDAYGYIAELCKLHGSTLEQCLQVNIDKLAARFPDKFTNEAALNRNLNAERTILEHGTAKQ